MLEGQWITAMDGAQEHKFAFNEAVSKAFLGMKKLDLAELQRAYKA